MVCIPINQINMYLSQNKKNRPSTAGSRILSHSASVDILQPKRKSKKNREIYISGKASQSKGIQDVNRLPKQVSSRPQTATFERKRARAQAQLSSSSSSSSLIRNKTTTQKIVELTESILTTNPPEAGVSGRDSRARLQAHLFQSDAGKLQLCSIPLPEDVPKSLLPVDVMKLKTSGQPWMSKKGQPDVGDTFYDEQQQGWVAAVFPTRVPGDRAQINMLEETLEYMLTKAHSRTWPLASDPNRVIAAYTAAVKGEKARTTGTHDNLAQESKSVSVSPEKDPMYLSELPVSAIAVANHHSSPEGFLSDDDTLVTCKPT